VTALMPQVYLPANTSSLSADGNIVASDSLQLNFGDKQTGGSILNTGTIASGGSLTVTTGTLTNQANQVDVGEIWQNVKGGYLETTGTTVQPGGFMSAAAGQMTLNVSQLKQIGGLLQEVNPDGSANNAATQQLLAQVLQQLGGNFTQTAVSDDLHTHFVAAGGFGIGQLAAMVAAVALSMMGMPVMAAMLSSAINQLASGQGFSFGDVLKAGAVALVTQGVDGNLGIGSFGSMGAGLVGPDLTTTLENLGTTLLEVGEQSVVNAAISTAIEGGSFLTAVKDNAVTDLAAVGAGAIGTASQDSGSFLAQGSIGYDLTHAALGCAASAAEGTGCAGGAIGGAVSALTANGIAEAVTGGQGVTNPAQLAMITAGTTLLSGTIAAALGQNAVGAVNAAANETLNNACDHACGQDKNDTGRVTVSPVPPGTSGIHDEGSNAGASTGVATATETVGAGPLASGLAGANQSTAANGNGAAGSNRPDFYVNSQGTALPATGYRYMGSQYTQQTQSTMTAPLSYFGFTDYSTAAGALNGYQIDPIQFNNDATLKGTFDTLQLFGKNGFVNARVPLENGGAGPKLEPFTSSYPQFGSGGQAQLVPILPGTTVQLKDVTVIPEK
jgi:filamentous hemagglutinin